LHRCWIASAYGLLFCSGVAGLGYQMTWTRWFAVGLGHELPSTLAVIAAFFGGLTLGAWALDGPIRRSEKPGRWYIGLEALIGGWGLVTLVLIAPANVLALRWIGVGASPLTHWLIAFVIPFAVLAPATTAMGATLPAMERVLARRAEGGRVVGGVYAANTAGAVAGTLGSAFWIIPLFGYSASVAILAGINIACAAAACGLFRSVRVEPDGAVADESWLTPKRLPTILFFTGLLGIGYEVLALRVLAQVLENTVYSFAAALSVFLMGTATGAAIYQRWLRDRAPARLLGVLLCLTALMCTTGMIALSYADEVYTWGRAVWGDSMLAVMAGEMLVASLVFAAPTLTMGATFSHLVQRASLSGFGVGRAMAVNTLGAMAAPAVFGLVVLSLFGTRWALAAASLGYLAMIPVPRVVPVWFMLAPLGMLLVVPSDLRLIQLRQGDALVAYHEGVMASVAVIETPRQTRHLRVNNRFQMGGTASSVSEQRQGAIPLLLHDQPKRSLFLGVGTGQTALAAAHWPNLRVDAVELVPQVLDVMRHFSEQAPPPRMTFHSADARRFVRASDRRYDVIVADLFHPARDGAGALYTVEHFEAVRQRLNDEGLFCQWLPMYQLDHHTAQLIVRTFLTVFPDATAFLMDESTQYMAIGLVGRRDGRPVSIPHDWLDRRVNDDKLRDALKRLNLAEPVRLPGTFVAGPDALKQYAGDGPINRDDRPLVVFEAPRFTYRRRVTGYGRAMILIQQAQPRAEQIVTRRTEDDAAYEQFLTRTARYLRAREMYLRGVVRAIEGDARAGLNMILQSVEHSHQLTTAYDRAMRIASDSASKNPAGARWIWRRLWAANPQRPDAARALEANSAPRQTP